MSADFAVHTIAATVSVHQVRAWRIAVRIVRCRDRSSVAFDFDIQFQTPPWCAAYMVSLVPSWCRTVLEPTPGIGNLVRALDGYQVTAPIADF